MPGIPLVDKVISRVVVLFVKDKMMRVNQGEMKEFKVVSDFIKVEIAIRSNEILRVMIESVKKR